MNSNTKNFQNQILKPSQKSYNMKRITKIAEMEKSTGRLQKQLRDLRGQEQKNKKDVKEYQENIAEERKQKTTE